MNQQMRQPRLNDLGNTTLIIFISHGLDMNNGGDGRGHEPGEADDTVDGDHEPNDQGVVIVGLAMLEREGLVDKAEIGKKGRE